MQPDVSNVKKMMAYAAQTASANSDSYRKAFEKPFISNTREFYARKAREWIQQDSTSAFLIKAEMALHEEEARVAAYLHASTKKPLLTEVERVLLRQNQTTLLEKERSGMAALLEAKQFDDLNRMFRLFARVENGLPPMAAIFIDHFKAKGNEIVAARAARLRKDAGTGLGRLPVWLVVRLADSGVVLCGARRSGTMVHRWRRRQEEEDCRRGGEEEEVAQEEGHGPD